MPLLGEIRVPGDKSISHRSVLVNAAGRGQWRVKNLLASEDVERSVRLASKVGVSVEKEPDGFIFESPGGGGFQEPDDVIDAGNSGTTIRMGAGLLASIEGLSVVTGDHYLRRRPMDRISFPLREMGASVDGRGGGTYPPLAIRGGRLKGIHYSLPVASAQVKSCILLAAACSRVGVVIDEPVPTRDHTERLLRQMGGRVKKEGNRISFEPTERLTPVDVTVPGDFSSAAFFIGGALITPGSEIIVRNVLLNPGRSGFLRVLERMGGNVCLENEREISGEPVGDIIVKYTETLEATRVGGDEVPSLIDEIPILTIVASRAQGVTEIRGAGELRVKESDRIRSMVTNLSMFGVRVEEVEDGMKVEGGGKLRSPGKVISYGDHRIVMSLEMLAASMGEELDIDDRTSVSTSFPQFYDVLGMVRR